MLQVIIEGIYYYHFITLRRSHFYHKIEWSLQKTCYQQNFSPVKWWDLLQFPTTQDWTMLPKTKDWHPGQEVRTGGKMPGWTFSTSEWWSKWWAPSQSAILYKEHFTGFIGFGVSWAIELTLNIFKLFCGSSSRFLIAIYILCLLLENKCTLAHTPSPPQDIHSSVPQIIPHLYLCERF